MRSGSCGGCGQETGFLHGYLRILSSSSSHETCLKICQDEQEEEVGILQKQESDGHGQLVGSVFVCFGIVIFALMSLLVFEVLRLRRWNHAQVFRLTSTGLNLTRRFRSTSTCEDDQEGKLPTYDEVMDKENQDLPTYEEAIQC